jgi:hypothetical protein
VTPQNTDWLRPILENPWLQWLIGLALVLLTGCYLLYNPMNLDVASLLHSTGRIYNGARLYVDIYDNNPPMIYLLYLPPVALAGLLSLPVIPVFYIYLLVVLCLSYWLSWSLIKIIYSTSAPLTRYCLFLTLIFLTLIPPLTDFGQREHLLFILTLPYILAAGVRSQYKPLSPWYGGCIGILAGIGFCIKPHFLLLWLFIEAYLIFKCRISLVWRRIENLAILFVLIIFGLYVLTWHSNFLRLVSLALRTYFAFENQGIWKIIKVNHTVKIWVLAGITMFFLKRRPQDDGPAYILFLASTAFLLIALSQKKGWPYHFYPCLAIACFIIFINTILWLEQLPELEERLWQGLAGCGLMLIVAIFLAGGYQIVRSHQGAQKSMVVKMIPFVKNHAQGKPIYVLTTHVTPTFPLVNYSGALFPYKFSQLWALPGFYQKQKGANKIVFHSPAQMEDLERWFFDTIISDLLSTPPVLLIVDQTQETKFARLSGLLGYFSQDPRFAQLLSRYEIIEKFDDYIIYRLQVVRTESQDKGVDLPGQPHGISR